MEASGARGWTRLDRHPPPCAFLTKLQSQSQSQVFWSSARSDTHRPPLRMSCCICRPPFCSRGIRNPLGASVSSSKQPVEWHQDRHVPTDGGPTTAACKICWRAVISTAIASTRVHGRRVLVCLTR
ncbi:hypothetical protein V8C34DRAFT_277641 [Trichoderma compactum]